MPATIHGTLVSDRSVMMTRLIKAGLDVEDVATYYKVEPDYVRSEINKVIKLIKKERSGKRRLKPISEITKMNILARNMGLTYGKYVALLYSKKQQISFPLWVNTTTR